jgi:small subunit ribosomal protein S13
VPRIAGVDIPGNKRIETSLQYLYGIGPTLSKRILVQTRIDPEKKTGELTEEEFSRLREVIERQCKVEGDLRREVSLNISRLMEIGSYRGIRHRHRLPVRGQRTRTNARTKRGPKQTVAGRGRRRGTAKK